MSYSSLPTIIIIMSIVMIGGPAVAEANPPPVSGPTTQSWSGYLLDGECTRARKATETDLGPKHTTKCLQMPACDRSGYGLLTDNNEYIPFDDAGNLQARNLVAKAHVQSNWRIEVQGKRAGNVLQVRKIKMMAGVK